MAIARTEKIERWKGQILGYLGLLATTFPIFISHLARTGMSLSDIAMTGHYDTLELAGILVAGSVWFPVYIIGYGIVAMLAPLIGRLRANGTQDDISIALNVFLWIAVLISVPSAIAMVLIVSILPVVGISSDVAGVAFGYIGVMVLGLPSVHIFNVLRTFCQGFYDNRATMYISIGGFFLNIVLNYAFIYGSVLTPQLGGTGAGLATAIVNAVSAGSLFIFVSRKTVFAGLMPFGRRVEVRVVFKVLTANLPSGFAMLVELLFLDVFAIVIATLGASALAANSILLNINDLSFALMAGIGTNASVSVGGALSLGSEDRLRKVIRQSIATTLVVASLCALTILIFFEAIFHFYSPDATVLSAGKTIQWLFVLLVMLDSLQVVLVGILRGAGNLRFVFLGPIIGYWIVGVPMALILGPLNAITPLSLFQGIWCGLVVGYLVNVAFLSFFVCRIPGGKGREQCLVG
jgi:multidrug resistance protein, MATE family